jgi:transcriptional regulator with XRE-family HTH domain
VDIAPYTEDLDLASVNTSEEFSAMLRTVHRRADKPSLRTLEALSRRGPAPLSKTVVSEMLKGTRFPRKAVVLAFLQACGIHGEQAGPWLRAWERIAERAAGLRAADPATIASDSSSEGDLAAGADAVEARLLREQVSQLSADNARLRMEVSASREAGIAGAVGPGGREEGRAVHSPPASRRELGVLLRALREERGITVEQAAARLLCSPGKVSRMESSFRSGTVRDVRDLCDLYGVTDGGRREHLMQLAQDSKDQGWRQSVSPGHIATYIGLENDAASIKPYHASVIPALLQTAGYARAVLRNGLYNLSPETIEQRLETRLARQRVLTRPSPPDYLAVIDEAVLRKLVGGPTVMREQLARMIEMSALSNVSFRVIPFSDGANVSTAGHFTILEFDGPVPSLVYSEGVTESLYMEKPGEVAAHRRAFEFLTAAALGEEDSVAFVERIIESMENR